MEIYLDSVDLSEVAAGVRLGFITGICIDSVQAAHRKVAEYRELVQEMCYLAQMPIHAPTLRAEAQDIVSEAMQISQWSPHVVVGIPATMEGLAAVHAVSLLEPEPDEMCVDCARAGECLLGMEAAESLLVFQGIRCTASFVCAIGQGLLAARAGADFISVPLTSLEQTGDDGMELLAGAVGFTEQYGLETQVIASSISSPLQAEGAMRTGAHAAAIPYTVLMECLRHPLTDRLLAQRQAE